MTVPRYKSNPKLHQVTYCVECEEVIPARAVTCFRCGARQPPHDERLQVVFCARCGRDYPAKAMTCMHCGLQNQRHPLLQPSRAG
ncbi:MAG: zinc ribbon domain-containing protein [Planctomycetota bacterium]